MTCIRCGETKREPAVHTFRRTIDGHTFLAHAEVEACARCREVEVPLATMLAFDRAVAAELAQRGPVSGDSFRFIRKAIPLQPIELARMLSVPLDIVNRWEAGRREMELAPWLVVAMLALEKLGRPSLIAERIAALREPRAAERVVALEDVRSARSVAPSRTLRDALTLLAGPIVLTDVDIADALGVALAPLRTQLDELARAGLVQKRDEVLASGAVRWEVTGDAGDVVQRGRERGIDVDGVLPRVDVPMSSHGPKPASVDRVVATTWRATAD